MILTPRHRSCFLLVSLLPAVHGLAQSTAFTYQGELKNAGQLASGLHDMQFRLFDAPTAGNQVGSTVCLDNVLVTSGRFQVQLDFGQQFAAPASRYLEMQVRADTGLDCSNITGFTVFTGRQLITAAPLATHAKSAYSLDAPDGSPLGAVFVDSGGLVGINTTTPGTNLTVAGNMELGVNNADYHNFRIGGGNSSGYLYGSFAALADGIHMGYNYFADAAVNHVTNAGGQTSRLSLGYGSIILATAGTNQVPVNRMLVDQNGNVGIGTMFPGAKLDVRGDIRMGSTGQFFAPSSEDNLRIVRGNVSSAGSVVNGLGYLSSRVGTGQYLVTFPTAFATVPTVTANADGTGALSVTTGSITTGSCTIYVNAPDGTRTNANVYFIAMGSR